MARERSAWEKPRPDRISVGADFRKAGIDFAEVLRVGGFQTGGQALALFVGGQDRVQQVDGSRGMLLVNRGHPGGLGVADFAVPGVKLVKHQLEQGRLAHAVATHEADLGAHGQAHGRVVEKPASPGVEGQIIDLQHGGGGL